MVDPSTCRDMLLFVIDRYFAEEIVIFIKPILFGNLLPYLSFSLYTDIDDDDDDDVVVVDNDDPVYSFQPPVLISLS